MLGQDIFISVGVDIKDLDDCYSWAFGEDCSTKDPSEADSLWNERHGDLFVLLETDPISEAFERIGKAFLQDKGE